MIQNPFFPEIHGNFGFGCMRLPMKDEKVDYEEFSRMADAFIASGLNYFDTAHGYLGGQSETAIRDCVAKRHDRNEFLLTDKLTVPYFNSQEDIRPFFEQQLAWCGVDYFDFYLMHAQDRNNYQKYKRCQAYETCYALKQEGLIRRRRFRGKPESIRSMRKARQARDRDGTGQRRQSGQSACERGSDLPGSERWQQRQLRPALCCQFPQYGRGSVGYERDGADAGQSERDAGFCPTERS